MRASADGDIKGIDDALARGADVNRSEGTSDRSTPLMAAAFNGQDAAVRHLIARGADPNAGEPPSSFMPELNGVFTPLYWAAMGGHESTVRLLLSSGAKPTEPTMSYLRKQPVGYIPAPLMALLEDAAKGGSAGLAAAPASPAPAAAIASDVDAPQGHAPPRPDDFALVVGIESYQSLPKAEYGTRDAEAVRRNLEALGVPARNIVALEGADATYSKLRSYLEEWLPRNVKPDSTLFVYFSGHGAPDVADAQAYLVPWDGDPRFLKSTALPLRKLYDDLGRIKAKHVLVALDACFSGLGARSVLPKGARPLVTKVDQDLPAADDVTILAAAGAQQIAGALDDQGHGAFTYYLLKGLAGAAAGSDGEVTALSLYDYLRPRVEDAAHRDNRDQTPVLSGRRTDFALAGGR